MPMRQLRTCDFCGDDAAGIYEVVPAELSPTEDEQRRVVLCESCQETLEAVVRPFLDRLGVRDEPASQGNRARSESPEPVPAASDATEREGVERRERPLAEPAEPTAEAAETEMPEHTAAENATRTDAGDDERTAPERSDDEATVRSETVDSDEATDAGGRADGGHPNGGDGDDRRVAGDESGENDDGERDEERPSADYEVDDARQHETATDDPEEDYEVVEDTDEAASDESEPPQFRKVMRLLNNREFPVDRAEFVDLASGAYDLDRSTADDIVDYAVRRDVLVEEDGQLRKA